MSDAAHLTLGEIIDIRDAVAVHDPPRFAVANSAGLLSALTTPFQMTFGQESFPNLQDKAAAIVFLLIANHPFYDGNKRIAAEALRLFFEKNGVTLRADDEELAALTQYVTSITNPRDPLLLEWITART